MSGGCWCSHSGVELFKTRFQTVGNSYLCFVTWIDPQFQQPVKDRQTALSHRDHQQAQARLLRENMNIYHQEAQAIFHWFSTELIFRAELCAIQMLNIQMQKTCLSSLKWKHFEQRISTELYCTHKIANIYEYMKILTNCTL